MNGAAPLAGPPAAPPPVALGRAAAGISALAAVSRASGFVRVLVVTAVLGTTFLGNTYQAANTVPNIVFELFVAGALHAVLVPTLVDVLDRAGSGEAARVAGALLGTVLAGLGVLAAVGMLASPLLMRLLTAGVDDPSVRDAQVTLGTALLLLFLPQVVLYGVGLVATGLLHADHRFAAPAIAPLANNLVVVVAYGVFWFLYRDPTAWPAQPLTTVEVLVLGAGTTLGVVALVAVPVVALARGGVRLRPRWAPRDPVVRRLGRHGGWAFVQVVASQLLVLAVLVLANATAGGVVAFQFALTMFLLPFGLVAVPVATAVFPRLRRLATEPDRFAAALGPALTGVAGLLLPAAAALIALAWPLVRVVAFGQAASAGLGTLVHAVMALAPGLVGYGAVLLLTRAAYARGDVRTPAVVLLAVLGAGVVAMVVASAAVGDTDRVTVLAAVHSAAYLVAAGMLWWRVARSLAPARLGAAGPVAIRAVAAVVSGIVMGAVVAVADTSGRWDSLLVVIAAGAVGLAVDVGVLRLLGVAPRSLLDLGGPASQDTALERSPDG